jgi:hypothetical protein
MSVEWEEDALDRLADIYVAATPAEREVIARSAGQINASANRNPKPTGSSAESVSIVIPRRFGSLRPTTPIVPVWLSTGP